MSGEGEHTIRSALGTLCICLLFFQIAFAQNDKQAALRQRVRALEALSHQQSNEARRDFAETHLTESLRTSLDEKELFSMLHTVGRASAGAGEVMVRPDSNAVRLSFRGAQNIDVIFALEQQEPFRIETLSVQTEVDVFDTIDGVSVAPITWENLRERLREEESAGFSGTIMVVRDGRVILHQGYGMANGKEELPNTTEIIFGIGSTAIDFTRAAILKLFDEGQLKLSDPITRFLSNVPPDKTSMTIRHLMNGQSGLPNFHHDPAKDEDYDLTWIDREEAVRRILDAPLLFAPGEDQAHSHSAFVLLAAVIEFVSGKAYAEFLHQNFFEPIGMRHTGFYGLGSGFSAEQMAVGYGPSRVGEVNIPLNWGPTSWLVMGSGGMVSNPGDMYRWVKAIHTGELLSEEALELYGRGNVYAGGSDRGFLFVYVDDPENTALISSNTHTRSGDLPGAVAQELVGLVTHRND